jgi:hypothetical protein
MTKCLLLSLVVTLALVGCGKKGGKDSEEASLEDLNRALSVMSMGGARRPADVHELTNFPSLRGKALPKPPAGKKLAIDQAHQMVVFVDQ